MASPPHDDSLLSGRALHAWYGSSHVLHGVDIAIGRGETLGLLGRNGMGKSTLIRTLLGHVARRDGSIRIADRITVMVNGCVIASDGPEAIRSNPQVQAAYLGH